MWPRPPTPITAHGAPGARRSAARRATRYAVRPASAWGATAAGATPSGSRTSARSSVRRYSAKPPSTSIPVKAWSAQCISSPRAHAGQRPQLTTGWAMTASPGLTERTAGPASSTQPAFSCPGTYGSSTSTRSRKKPPMTWRSVRQRPAPAIRTMTSVAPPSSGAGTSSTDSSDP